MDRTQEGGPDLWRRRRRWRAEVRGAVRALHAGQPEGRVPVPLRQSDPGHGGPSAIGSHRTHRIGLHRRLRSCYPY